MTKQRIKELQLAHKLKVMGGHAIMQMHLGELDPRAESHICYVLRLEILTLNAR